MRYMNSSKNMGHVNSSKNKLNSKKNWSFEPMPNTTLDPKFENYGLNHF